MDATFAERADGARGYPGRISAEELATKFMACARRSLTEDAAGARSRGCSNHGIDSNVTELTKLLVT